MKAIRIEEYGGPDALRLRDLETPKPGSGEARVRLEAIGVNYIDIYHRTGFYALTPPFTPGSEGAGVVDAVGPHVTDVKVGDRVAFAMHVGAYADTIIVPAWKLVPLPDKMGTLHAASIMLQGLTAHYLTRSTYPIKPGESVLIHSAAGGVGHLLVQVAKHLGAFVIGTVSATGKAQMSKEAGADEIINYKEKDFVQEVKRITSGNGVHVVYDSVGQDTFDGSLDCLRRRGMLVSFGQSSGPVAPINPLVLSTKGSLFLSRPTLAHYTANREELLSRTKELFEWETSGAVKVKIDQTFPLADVAHAHRRLESRASIGKILLIP
jgi:NADPH2:quinone reductase